MNDYIADCNKFDSLMLPSLWRGFWIVYYQAAITHPDCSANWRMVDPLFAARKEG